MDLSIKRILFKNFRSYESFELSNIGALTVLAGPNAVGKTNVVEGVQLLTALSSFRHATVDQLVQEGRNQAFLDIDLTDGNRQLTLSLHINEGKRSYSLNGKAKRPADLKGVIPSVVFTPDDLELAKGSSTPRRAALDALGSQLSSNHYVIKRDYEKVVRYKNRLLKEEAPQALIDSIDDTLVTCGAQLTCYRSALFEKLAPMMQSYYDTIADGREKFQACYIPSWEKYDPTQPTSFSCNRDSAREALSRTLEIRRGEERVRRRSLVGPHADHLEFFIAGRNASLYGSQGQQRSIVLAYKLAEVSIIQEILHQKPVLLLDDVMSELDATRRAALMSFIEDDIQTFITTTNLSYFDEALLARARVIELPLKKASEISIDPVSSICEEG